LALLPIRHASDQLLLTNAARGLKNDKRVQSMKNITKFIFVQSLLGSWRSPGSLYLAVVWAGIVVGLWILLAIR